MTERPGKPEGHDYHRCRCEPCNTLRSWMKRQYDAKRRAARRLCAVDGCGKPASGALTYCGAHHGRRSRTGVVGSATSRTNDGHARHYQTAHNQIRLQRGAASTHLCVDCAAPAADWSLKHDSKQRIVALDGTRAGLAFSPDPTDYEPRCKPCHVTYDREANRGRDLGYGAQVSA